MKVFINKVEVDSIERMIEIASYHPTTKPGSPTDDEERFLKASRAIERIIRRFVLFEKEKSLKKKQRKLKCRG